MDKSIFSRSMMTTSISIIGTTHVCETFLNTGIKSLAHLPGWRNQFSSGEHGGNGNQTSRTLYAFSLQL